MKPVSQLITQYTTSRVARNDLAPSSAEVIRSVLRNWLRWVDNTPPDTWTIDHVSTWVNQPHIRPSTRKSRLTKLRPFVHWLIVEGHLDRDPTLGMGRIQIPSLAPRDLTHGEVRQLLAVCPDRRAVLIITLMVQMGLRVGDLSRVRIEDIDVRARLLHVRAKGGGGEHTHWEPIPSEAWDLITAELRTRTRLTGPLVRSYQPPFDGLTPNYLGRMIRSWLYEAGLKDFSGDGRSAHSLRHSCAQHMIDRGADLRDVQHALGHRSIRSTELYIRRLPTGLAEALDGRSYLDAA